MSIVEQARNGLRQLNAGAASSPVLSTSSFWRDTACDNSTLVLRSEGDDGRVRYLSVALDFDFDGELCRVRNLPAG
ncbi:MAG: hypothetical protein OXD37_03285 [Acidimicrobiaceae bacterium]|nr:hypothetical protein [Acidimicrobiaceae bacterium]